MGIRLPGINQAKQILRRSLQSASQAIDVPKGYLACNLCGRDPEEEILGSAVILEPTIISKLTTKGCAEEEFGYDHPMGGLTVPCKEDIFLVLTSNLDR